MPPHPVISCALVLAALAAVAMLAKAASNRRWHPELPRKLIHVGMGLVCLPFPWLFDHPLPVQILAAFALLVLIAVRLVPALRRSIGAALHAVPRRSVGELLFPVSVGTLFTLAHDTPVHYVIPLLLLSVADAAGALLDLRFGRIRYNTGDGQKSLEGSLAFLLCAFLCAYLPLLLGTDTGPLACVLIALILALLTMIAEAVSSRGLDNFIIPVAGLFLLRILLELPAHTLAIRLLVLILLLALVLIFRNSSSLHGSGLLAAAFLGYGCFALGGWRFVLPPLGLFLAHLLATRRLRPGRNLTHGVDSIASLTLSSLPWLLLKAAGVVDASSALIAFAGGFATHLAIMHCRTELWRGMANPGLPAATSKGLGLAALPVIILESLPPNNPGLSLPNLLPVLLSLPALVALATASFNHLARRLPEIRSVLLFAEALFAFISSLATFAVLLLLP